MGDILDTGGSKGGLVLPSLQNEPLKTLPD